MLLELLEDEESVDVVLVEGMTTAELEAVTETTAELEELCAVVAPVMARSHTSKAGKTDACNISTKLKLPV